MTSLLRRLTITKPAAGGRESDHPSRTLTSSTSFSDFSMGTHIDGELARDVFGPSRPGCAASLAAEALPLPHDSQPTIRTPRRPWRRPLWTPARRARAFWPLARPQVSSGACRRAGQSAGAGGARRGGCRARPGSGPKLPETSSTALPVPLRLLCARRAGPRRRSRTRR